MYKFKYLLLILLIFLFHNANASTSNKIAELIGGSFEEIEKTLDILDKMFNNNEDRFLEKIIADSLLTSERYYLLKKHIKTSKINFNHRSELCKKEFILNSNEKDCLIIIFEKNMKTNNWLIFDAYRMKNKSRIEIKEKGFSPLSITNNFQDFLIKLNTSGLNSYYGLAKHGKLNKQFLKRHSITLSKNSEMLIKDIIIYNNGVINDIIYLKLKYYPIGRKENKTYKGGWLLVDSASMSHLYTDNLYIDFLLNRLDPASLNLDQPNKFIFTANIRELTKNNKTNKYLKSFKVQDNLVLKRTIKLKNRLMCGEDVKKIQERLNSLGYIVNVDSCYGIKSFRAIQNFQRRKQITPDGIIGPETYRLLFSN